jgi:hypothetical protein
VVDNNKTLLVDFQAQGSGDGGLNDIPIKVATKTVCTLLTVAWDIQSSVCYYPLLC